MSRAPSSSDTLDLLALFDEAGAIADAAGQPLGTLHLLLALFTEPNPAERILAEKRLDEATLLAKVGEVPAHEAPLVSQVLEKSQELAKGVGQTAGPLHLLATLLRTKQGAAFEALVACGVVPAALANEVRSYLVGPLPKRYAVVAEPRSARAAQQAVRTPPPPLPSLPPPTARHDSQPGRLAPGHVPPRVPSNPPAARSNVSQPPTTLPPVPRPSSPLHSKQNFTQPGRSRTSTIDVVEPPEDRGPDAPGEALQRTSRLSSIRRLADSGTPHSAEFQLDPARFPYLASHGRNLTALAADGGIDPVIGRDKEIDEALDVLGKRRSNNPVLVGEPGVGKTAIAEGIALALVQQHRALGKGAPPPRLIVELEVAKLVAGTALRGSLSEKLTAIKDEVRDAAGRVVVFIDEIHTLVGAGQTGDGAQDASNELKAALARGEFPCIGATTFAEFQRYFAQDPALERRFAQVVVHEPTIPQAIEILRGVAPRYGGHHGVTFTDESVEAAAVLSSRYVRDRALPDKAVAVLDHAGSRVRREGRTEVTRADVAKVVARIARLPEDRLLVTDAERVLNIQAELSRRVVGHADVVGRVGASIRRSFAGFSGNRPLASFIFLGPTGVGKTELARSLADVVFGTPDALVRVDMSEFSESHTVSKLVGAPPGYVGFEQGGQLTEAVRRRPACVVLLDEIEKGAREAWAVVLQLLDEGHLTDGRGRRVDFTSTVVVLTSNLGSEAFSAKRERSIGFGAVDADTPEARRKKAETLAKDAFPPELWGRIEDRLVFAPLTRPDLHKIAHLLAARTSQRLQEDKGIQFELDDAAIDHIIDGGNYDLTQGARPMRQTLQRLVEGPLAERILRGEIQARDRIRVVVRGNQLHFEALTIIDPSFARKPRPETQA